ncbi:hypothetical protein BSNK01_11720 [Bacillaceae bacterium]
MNKEVVWSVVIAFVLYLMINAAGVNINISTIFFFIAIVLGITYLIKRASQAKNESENDVNKSP